MKSLKRILRVIVLVSILLSIYSLTPTLSDREPTLDEYNIHATLIEDNRTLLVREIIKFKNKYNTYLNNICLHVYSNAPIFRSSGANFTIRYIRDLDAMQQLNYTLSGIDGTLLIVKLLKELLPGEIKTIEIYFSLRIPLRRDRFGYYDDIYALGTWYPILAVYREDRGDWNRAPYYPYGESYNFDFANYNVYLNVSKDMVVAATGVKVGEHVRGERKILHFKAECVREHCIVMSSKFKVKTKIITIGSRTIKVTSYHIPEHEREANIALEAAAYSLKLYSNLYGPYPYPVLRVCEVHGWFGGMEYPMLVMITSTLYSPRRRDYLELVVAHEVAHQWWYCVIANDEGEEPWMDEAFAEYSGVLYFEFKYGRSKFREMFKRTILNPLYRYLSRYEDDVSARSVWYFGADVYKYVNIVYNKGACTLHMLRLILKDDLFFKSLKEVYRRYKFKRIRIVDFIKTVEEAVNRDLDWFFRAWVYSKGIPSYSIAEAVARAVDGTYRLTVVVRQLNPEVNMTMYVPITVYGWYGTKYMTLVKVEGRESKALIDLPFEPRFVRVDEEDLVLGKDDNSLISVEVKYTVLSEEEVQLQVSVVLFLIVLNVLLLAKLSRRGRRK